MADKTKKFYSMKKIRAQNNNIGRVDIYGLIDALEYWGDEITPDSFAADLNALGAISEIEVHIFSHGGDMFASLAIYRALKSRKEKVKVYIEGIAASGGSIISCAGDVVYMPPEAMMFVHNLLTDAYNINEHDARELLDEMVELKEPMINAYMAKCGKSHDEIVALLDGANKKGTWLSAAKAIEIGLADEYTPVEKLPIDAAARMSPGVFNFKGHKIDCSCYDKAAEKTAGIINSSGGIFMAFFNRKKNQKAAAKPKPKAEITFVEMVCPSCNGAVNMNPETGETFAGGVQVEAQTEPQKGESQKETVLARRMPGNVRTAIYSVDCPHCGNQFVWDTDINTDGGNGTTTTPAVPLNTPAPAAKPEQGTAPAVEAATAACPNCGADVEYDTATAEKGTDEETGAEGYLLTCQSCNTQFIEPIEATDPNAVPVGASAKEQAAYKAGVMAERNRQSALDEMALAAPAQAAAIQAAKKSGTTAETMSRNIIKAMAQGKGGVPGNAGAAQFAAALGKDLKASNVNSMRVPAHAAAPKTVQASAYERRIEEHNKARRGEENG